MGTTTHNNATVWTAEAVRRLGMTTDATPGGDVGGVRSRDSVDVTCGSNA